MPDYIIVRLHPSSPVAGSTFTSYLTNLTITAFDKSFRNIDGGPQIGQAVAPATIVQHGAAPSLEPVATAVIEITNPTSTEYRTSDVILDVERSSVRIMPRITHYNIAVITKSSISDPASEPASTYVGLPPPGIVATPSIELPTDGTPPNFTELQNAVIAVLNQDPTNAAPGWDLAALTWQQCVHIANELVWNGNNEPMPEHARALKELYSPTTDPFINADRQRFEAEVQGYYTQRQAEAEQLARYIYSMSAALYCANESVNASRVGLRYPIQPGVTDASGRIKEAVVMLEN